MLELRTYRGHIRNYKALEEELGLAHGLKREEREKAIIHSILYRNIFM